MARKRIGGPKSRAFDWCQDCLTQLDCRCLPHGFYSLIPAVLSTLAFWTAIVQDGCDYVKIEGGSVEKITKSDVLPFIEAGLSHYRTPVFHTQENVWAMVFVTECQEYPEGTVGTLWMLAQYFNLVSAIFGGSLALFIWFTTCMTFSIRTWRFCAFEGIVATIFRALSFVSFGSSICTGNDSQCKLAYGSQMDIVGVILYAIGTIAILAHYPDSKLNIVTDDEIVSAEAENLQPTLLAVPTSQGSSRSLAGGESNRYWDEASYAADPRSSVSQSYYNRSYTDSQSMLPKGHVL